MNLGQSESGRLRDFSPPPDARRPAPAPLAAERLDAASLADGTSHLFKIPVCALPDGSELSLPVFVLSGRAAGPRLMVVGGVHGDEADGIAAAMALAETLDPQDFAGRVTIIPIANPMAFAAGQRRSPVDGLDLNRICPGDHAGRPSERLAAALATIVRQNADFLFTLHGWYATGMAHPHVEFDLAEGPTQAASRAACFAAGFELVVAADWPPGLLPKVAVNAGIPAIESEIGGLGESRSENVSFLLARIEMLMTHLRMRGTAPPAPSVGTIHRHCYVAAPATGLLRWSAVLSKRVEAGERLAEVCDLAGRHIADVTAPEAGILVTQRRYLSVAADENVATILVPQSEDE